MTQETIQDLKEVRVVLGQIAQKPDVDVATAEKLLEMAYQVTGVLEDDEKGRRTAEG